MSVTGLYDRVCSCSISAARRVAGLRSQGQLVGARGRVIASDILPMDQLADVTFIQGDFTEEADLRPDRDGTRG